MSAQILAEQPGGELPRVCFIHIPKTAGTAVRSYFAELYGDAAFHGYTTEDYRFADDALLARYRFYAGHCYQRDWSRLAPETTTFTILRDPVARAISLYRYWNRIDYSHLLGRPDLESIVDAIRLARSVPIEEFIISDSPFIVEQVRGGCARQFLSDVTLAGWTRTMREEPAIFAEAVERLFALGAVLTTERLRVTLPRLLSRLGLPWIDRQFHCLNSSSGAIAVEVARLREILIRISPIDFHLHAVAQQIEAKYL